jgi:organic radical activating enzyme
MIYNSSIKVKNSLEIIDSLSKDKDIIIFGTGNFGQIVLTALKKAGLKAIFFCDNNEGNWNKTWNGLKVLSHAQLSESYSDNPVLVASLNYSYIKKQLKKFNIKKIYDVDFIFSNIDLDLKKCGTNWSARRCKEQIDSYMFATNAEKLNKDKLRIKHLDLVLTEKCSLKCKDCSNLMQYYAKPNDEDYELLIYSLDQFMNNVDFVNEVRLIGGEPMMYKKIDQVTEKILTYNNFEKIFIYTNGTIVPKGNKLNAFRNEKVLFKISDYGKISKNVNKLEEALSDAGIHYITERITSWQNCALIKPFNRSKELTKHIYGNCCVNQFLTLLHGKLYLCPFQAHAENLNAIPKAPKDSIDLKLTNGNVKKKIHNLYYGRDYLEACKSCNGRDPNVSNVDAAIQTKDPLQYQVIS